MREEVPMRYAPALVAAVAGLVFPVPSAALVTVGALDVPLAHDVEIVDGSAYVVNSGISPDLPGRLRVIDVSDPGMPNQVGAFTLGVVGGLLLPGLLWLRRRRLLGAGLALAAIAFVGTRPVQASVPADRLYASNGSIDQNDGSITPWAAPPASVSLAGIAFDSRGRLFATGCTPLPCSPEVAESVLLELDPQTGAVLETLGPVSDASGERPTITALAVQPGTDVLYGFGSLAFGLTRIWRIDRSSGAASLVSAEVPAGCSIGAPPPPLPPPCSRESGFDFAPDGTLFHAFGSWLVTLDPSTGAELSSVPSVAAPTLAVRSDGFLFTTLTLRPERPCPTCPPPLPITVLATIDPLTGSRTGVGSDEGFAGRDLAFSPSVVERVDIDIKPGSDTNGVNPMSRGVIPIAILGSGTLGVADVDVTTLRFGPAGAPLAHRNGPHVTDANHDGAKDLLAHFRTEESGLAFGDTEACVTGEQLDGTSFEGCDGIRTVPACGLGFELALLLPGLMWVHRRRKLSAA